MKYIGKYLIRDKVDLAIWIITILAVAQIPVIGKDLTIGFAVFVIYVFAVMMRLGTFIDIIMEQDHEIKKLNERIHEKNEFIVDLIRKYGTPKEGQEFLNNLRNQTKEP